MASAVSGAHSKCALPEHVVAEWFGHDKRASDKNYKNVTSLNFATVWPSGTEVPQQAEDVSRTAEKEKMLGERQRPKTKQKPARGGRNWQSHVYEK